MCKCHTKAIPMNKFVYSIKIDIFYPMDCLYLSKFGSLKRQGTDKEHLAYTKPKANLLRHRTCK